MSPKDFPYTTTMLCSFSWRRAQKAAKDIGDDDVFLPPEFPLQLKKVLNKEEYNHFTKGTSSARHRDLLRYLKLKRYIESMHGNLQGVEPFPVKTNLHLATRSFS